MTETRLARIVGSDGSQTGLMAWMSSDSQTASQFVSETESLPALTPRHNFLNGNPNVPVKFDMASADRAVFYLQSESFSAHFIRRHGPATST